MLKIGKGLKKKKKSKKHKHKDEELFTEEELEQYRREHQQKAAQEVENLEEKSEEASEELQKFKLLTAGVDDVLRETQGRLDRIKKESFFQRKPTPSDLKAQEEKERELQKQTKGNWIGFEEGGKAKEEEEEEVKEEQQEESESEYEFEETDDLFDTTYVDAIESGEVKLAYVPDDEEVEDQGPDPFDTSTAEEILKKVEEEEKKKKKQISLGIAVDVLTGRAERDKSILQETGLLEVKPDEPGQINKPRKRPRKIQDFSLLGSFDDNSNLLVDESGKAENKTCSESACLVDPPKSLLDDDLIVDCELPEGEVLINEILVKQNATKKECSPVEETEGKEPKKENLEELLSEFDTVKEGTSVEVRKLEEEDDFDEFTALAASSVANQKLEEELHIYEDLENDPFDTSIVNNILKEDKADDIFGSVEGEIPPPETKPDILAERNWSAFQKEEEEKEPIDPFDTTYIDNIQPGKCELKLLENEILGDIVATAHKSDIHQEARILSRSDSDFDFNLRGEDTKNITESVLQAVHSKVSIQITDPSGIVETQRSSVSESSEGNFRQLTYQHRDLLGGSTSDLSKLGDEPLPPSVESPVEDFSKYSDPFDTSIVEQVAAPGKAELKFIEKELLSDICTNEASALSDDDFDPRAEEKAAHKVTFDIPPEVQSDLLSSVREEGARPLTPYYSDPAGDEEAEDSEVFEFSDPFDTSHVISLPGKVEIKLIEKELENVESKQPVFIPVHQKLGISEEDPTVQPGIKHSLSDHDFNPREGETEAESSPASRRFSDVTGLIHKPPSSLTFKKQDKPDLLVVEEELPVKALTPAVEEDISSYIDPFDTSIAENIAPGRAELKVLENELIAESANAESGIKRSYTDPDFDPRDDNPELVKEIQKPDISVVLGLPENGEVAAKPLSPIDFEKADEFDDTDPFDTSIAANLVPGKAELRILESELIDYGSSQNDVASSNPFLTSDFAKESTGVDNPFLSGGYEESYGLPETNPFADFGNDYAAPYASEPMQQPQVTQSHNVFATQDFGQPQIKERPTTAETLSETRPNELDLISTTNINDAANDFVVSSDEETSKPKRPPPPKPAAPRPSMPKETQDLILSVTGALKATSDHLLDRLPPTRAPSPTAFPDFHSPSPTPDTFTDLLGNEQPNVSQTNIPAFPSNDNLSILTQPQKPMPAAAVPPPRPPPARPAPPKPAPPVLTQPASQPQEDDMFDLFGTSRPPPPKTKDAILNLYSQPKPQPKDLLSDDLLSDEIPIPTVNLLGNQEPPLISTSVNLISTTPATIEPETPKAEQIMGESEPEIVEEPAEQKEVLSAPEESTVQNTEDDNFLFGTRPAEAAAPEVEKTSDIVAQEDGIQEQEDHYIFGTKPVTQEPISQEPIIFGTEPVTEPEVPIFGTTKPAEDTIFGMQSNTQGQNNYFGSTQVQPQLDAFDAFAAKFEQADPGHKAGGDLFDPFAGSGNAISTDAWGTAGTADDSEQQGFGGDDSFDAFLSMSRPPPQSTPNKLVKTESGDSDDGGFNVFIKPRESDYQAQQTFNGAAPAIAPPPKSPVGNSVFGEGGPRFNPFDKGESAYPAQQGVAIPTLSQAEPYEGGFKRSDSQETPPTPLFDEDVSQPLEDFPRIHYEGDGWEMQLRQPNKKKITGQRFWKKIFVKLVYQGDNPVLQLFNLKEDKDPFQELPLQACYSVSDISAQQYDQFGKIFTVKLQYIFYKERPGVRPGQVTKAERITNKLSQFAAYAIQGDYQGVKEFGSDLKKLGLPVEHAPQISQLLKLGCMSYEDLKQFSVTIEECLFRMPVHRDRALTYKMEEVQITVVDEIYVEQDALGHVDKQIARVRLFFLGFLSGMPDVELGLNDMWRQGKEVVGRHDIIPVVTEEWIRLEAVEFHSCIQQEEYEKTRTIKFKPPDACYIELMRFRIRPPKNRELPLQLKAVMCITGSKVELRADVLVPGFASRKLGQIPCEDVMIRFPIPECWIYLFRVEKHFRYGSVKSAHRRTGKIKGIERFLGAVETLEPSLMEVTSGQAKYEHQHRALVWRMPRLPKEGQGAYTTHNLVCRMQLTSFDQIPDNLAEYAYVEFTMPATQASHTTVRSVSLCDSPSDNPPEKYVRQLARHEYRVGIEHVHTEETAAYEAATMFKPKTTVPETVPEAAAADSDSDSSD